MLAGRPINHRSDGLLSADGRKQIHKNFPVDPRTTSYVLGIRKKNLKEFAARMLKKHNDSVYVKFVETEDKYGHFAVYSKSIDVIENTERWIRYMESECIKLIEAGAFVPRKFSKVKNGELSSSSPSVKLVEASCE